MIGRDSIMIPDRNNGAVASTGEALEQSYVDNDRFPALDDDDSSIGDEDGNHYHGDDEEDFRPGGDRRPHRTFTNEERNLSIIPEESRINSRASSKHQLNTSSAFDYKAPAADGHIFTGFDGGYQRNFSVNSDQFKWEVHAMLKDAETSVARRNRFIQDDPRFNQSHFDKENSWEPEPPPPVNVRSTQSNPNGQKAAINENQWMTTGYHNNQGKENSKPVNERPMREQKLDRSPMKRTVPVDQSVFQSPVILSVKDPPLSSTPNSNPPSSRLSLGDISRISTIHQPDKSLRFVDKRRPIAAVEKLNLEEANGTQSQLMDSCVLSQSQIGRILADQSVNDSTMNLADAMTRAQEAMLAMRRTEKLKKVAGVVEEQNAGQVQAVRATEQKKQIMGPQLASSSQNLLPNRGPKNVALTAGHLKDKPNSDQETLAVKSTFVKNSEPLNPVPSNDRRLSQKNMTANLSQTAIGNVTSEMQFPEVRIASSASSSNTSRHSSHRSVASSSASSKSNRILSVDQKTLYYGFVAVNDSTIQNLMVKNCTSEWLLLKFSLRSTAPPAAGPGLLPAYTIIYGGRSVFEAMEMLKAGETREIQIAFCPSSPMRFHNALQIAVVNVPQREYKVALYGCGGNAIVQLNTDNAKIEVSPRDGQYILRSYNMSEFAIKLRNIGIRDAFLRIAINDRLSGLTISDVRIQPAAAMVLLPKQEMEFKVHVPHESNWHRAGSALSLVHSSSASTSTGSLARSASLGSAPSSLIGGLQIIVYWGEENQRQRLRQYVEATGAISEFHGLNFTDKFCNEENARKSRPDHHAVSELDHLTFQGSMRCLLITIPNGRRFTLSRSGSSSEENIATAKMEQQIDLAGCGLDPDMNATLTSDMGNTMVADITLTESFNRR